MARKNYFEILGLEFDPPESNKRKIEKAIEAWKKRMEDAIGSEQIDSNRQRLKEELSWHDDMVEVLKTPKTRNVEARDLKEKKKAQLEQLIDIMLVGESGKPEVTNAQIRNVQLKLRLSMSTIEETYKNKGFEVQKRTTKVKIADNFLDKSIADEIKNKIEEMGRIKQPYFPWFSQVKDLFELACYYSTGSDADIASYRRKKTSDLENIMQAGANQYVSDMSEPGHLLTDLFTAGVKQVFNSEENRKKYERTIECEKLAPFFALLKTAPEDFKKDRFFADSCIRTIQKSFPDYDLALALYNREVGLVQDPYEPIEALIRLSCGICHTPMEFRTRQDAEKGTCSVCGASLYTACPSCGKKVPSAADWCSCGFRISEMRFFDEYFNAAEFALKEMNLAEARKQLANAENANPKHPKLATLRAKIKQESDKFQKPLDDLDAFMKARLYTKAQKHLEFLAASMPQLKLDKQSDAIKAKMQQVEKMMPSKSLPVQERANRCIEILDIVKDFQPAMDMLSICQPGAPIRLTASIGSGEPLTCSLSWAAAGDKGVSYYVVRKTGGVPRTHSDGEILAAEWNGLEYKDKTIQPGISYGYGVFAYRCGIYSNPAVCEAEKFSELDKTILRATADSGACRFTWALPKNSIGVRILRSTNAIPSTMPNANTVIVAEKASANFEDRHVTNNTAYGYRLQCVYPYGTGFRYSEGLTMMLTPEQPPVALKNITAKTQGRTVQIKWELPDNIQRNVMIREVHSPDVANMIGQIISASEINAILGKGIIYMDTTSLTKQCQFDIPVNTSVLLAVVTIAGAKGIVSGVVRASSVEKCEIDKNQTRIEGNRLKIMLKNQPNKLYRIHYIMAKKVSDKVPWATIEDAKNNNLTVIPIQDYKKDGMILIENPPQTDLYISVIGEFRMADGSTVYSEPAKCRISNKPKDKIKYQLKWGTGMFSSKPKAKDCKLYITSDAEETPELKLIYCSDGHIPKKLDDPKNVVLHVVPEFENGYPSGQYVYAFPDSVWNNVPEDSSIRLMMEEEDMKVYDLLPENIASLKVPKK